MDQTNQANENGVNQLEQTVDAEHLASAERLEKPAPQAKENYKLDNSHIEVNND